MSNATRSVHPLPISHVRVEGQGLCLDEQRVYCQRKSRTVSVGECRECRHFRALRPGVRDALACLLCDEAPTDSELPSHFHLPRLCAGDLMTRDVVCVRPDLSLDAAALLMLEQPGQTLPVVDASGLVIGTLSDAELQLEVQAARTESATVMAAMTPCPLLIPEGTPITRAAAVMAFESVSCLVVVSPAGTVSGMLMATDLLSWLARADGYLSRPRSSSPPPR